MTGWMPLLAWRPFLDPMTLIADRAWLALLLPLVVAIAAVYRALRSPEPIDRAGYIRAVVRISFQIVAAMLLASVGLWLLVERL